MSAQSQRATYPRDGAFPFFAGDLLPDDRPRDLEDLAEEEDRSE